VVKGAIASGVRRFYEFGVFRLDPTRRRLSRDGEFLPLYPKAVEALIILVEHSGEILEREALISVLWPGTIVEESNLTVAVSHLRKALNGNGDDAEFIQTIPRVGYRFVADVREVVEEPESLITGGGSAAHEPFEIGDAGENGAATCEEQSPRRIATVAPSQTERHPLSAKTGWLLAGAVSAIAIACLLLAIAVNVLLRERSSVTQSGMPKPEKSIAVLPFENLSNDREDTFFADGVQDDLLTKLANIADLRVISRTSVMQYRGKRDIGEIGDALRVSHVLEGSVRKTGAWLHINAQLIDTRTDSHVWAKQYDGDLKDLFAIQSEIAQKVAERLHAKISKAERLAIERPPTADLSAFNLYSRAKSLLLVATSINNGKSNLLKAADLLNQAIAHDPSFFQAYCQLAHTHNVLYFLGYDHTPARLGLADVAIQTAFRLRPDAGEAHLVRAENLYRGYLDYNGTLAELENAEKNLPNSPQVLEMRGYILRRQGKQVEALESLKRAADLDPRNVLIMRQIAASYDNLRRYSEEKSVLERALSIMPNDVDIRIDLVRIQFEWKAEIQPLRELIDSIRTSSPSAAQSVADAWLLCALAERDATEAGNALIVLGETPFTDDPVQLNSRLMEGVIARMLKDEAKAQLAFSAARSEQEKIVQAQPDYGPALCVLGLIDAGLGRKEDALREARRAVELLPADKDAIYGPTMIKYLAMIAAWVGEKDFACEQLAAAARIPGPLSYGQLKLLPFWDPLRGDPRFEAIVASLAPKN
jgi:TolB-like protein/DNA-binding winged helix-turn-helix (wHTH) protein/Flp pilus assembly protein TadD